eukprot:361695-Karenia_brevis.AAC.1
MATSVLKSSFCKHASVQLSYAIGVAKSSPLDEDTGMQSQRSADRVATHIVQLQVEAPRQQRKVDEQGLYGGCATSTSENRTWNCKL